MDHKPNPDELVDPQVEKLLNALKAVPEREAEAARRSREKYLAALAGLQAISLPWYRKIYLSMREELEKMKQTNRFAVIGLAVVMVLAVILGGAGVTAVAAQDALPGDALYGLKTGMENTRLDLAGSAAAEAELHLQFAERRLTELSRLVDTARYERAYDTAAAFQDHINMALAAVRVTASGDPARAQELNLRVSDALTRYAESLSNLLAGAPAIVRPAVEQALQASQGAGDGNLNGNDNGNINGNANDDNGNDANANDDNGNDANANDDDNANDDANANDDDNGNDDDANTNDDDNGNDDDANANDDDNGNDDDANTNDDDNGNDDANANDDDNGNDDANANDDDNGNDDDANANDDDSGNDDDANANDDDSGNDDDANANDDDNGNDDNGNN